MDAETPDLAALEPAAAILRRGGLVAFPTETVYGLGADGLQPEAVQRIFVAKDRPADNPLILHVASVEQAEKLMGPGVDSDVVRRLVNQFWPGPLTLIVPKASHIPDEVTAGLQTVAIRLPQHPVARLLIQQADRPIAAPSANRSGRPSPTRASHVLDDLGGRIDGIVDGGPCGVGLESTVLDITEAVPLILRPGGITQQAIAVALGRPVGLDARACGRDDVQADAEPIRSPGMKYKHYAPSTPLLLLECRAQPDPARLQQAAAGLRATDPRCRIGLLLTDETARLLDDPNGFPVARLGPRERPDQIAAELFHTLRAADQAGFDWIIVEGIADEGVGLAIMNRLRRAATKIEPGTE